MLLEFLKNREIIIDIIIEFLNFKFILIINSVV